MGHSHAAHVLEDDIFLQTDFSDHLVRLSCGVFFSFALFEGLSLRRKSVFGDVIVFCAPVRLLPLYRNATIAKLVDRIDAARQRGYNPPIEVKINAGVGGRVVATDSFDLAKG